MRGLTTDRQRDLQALGLIALVVLAWLWPVTIGGRLLSPADMLMVMQPWKAHAREVGFQRVQTPFLDAIQQHYPWRKFAAEQLRRGEIPLWNPHMMGGVPFVANNQSAVFYPETWLFALMPPERALGWSALLSLLMGGGFMYWFLRLQGLRRAACVIGVLPFLMSGFMVGWLLLPTVRAVPMWLPLMLVAYEQAVRGKGLGWVATCGLAIGMQFLAGHLHVSVMVMLVFGAYVVFRVVRQRPGGPVTGWQAAGHAVGAAALGAMLAAVQLLPVLELVGMNPRRAGLDFGQLAANRMPLAYLLAGLMPDLFGSPVDYNFWGKMLSATGREYVETVWYSGVAAVLLAGLALVWKRQRTADTWFWAAVWLGGLGMAWGTVVYWVLLHVLPPLRQLPGISRGIFLCCFATAVLAARGVQALLDRAEAGAGTGAQHTVAWLSVVVGVVALAGGLGVWLFTGGMEEALPGIGGYTLAQMGRCLGLVVGSGLALAAVARRPQLGLALTGLVLAADLLYFAGHFTPEVPAKYLQVPTRVVEFLQARTGEGSGGTDGSRPLQRATAEAWADGGPGRMTSLIGDGEAGFDRMPPNTPMIYGLEDVQGSDSLVFEGYADLWGAIPKDNKGNPDPASPVLDLMSCRYVVTTRDLSAVPGWRRVLEAECMVWENMEALPRAYLAAREEQVEFGPATVARVTAPAYRPVAVTYTPPLNSWPPTRGSFRPLSVTSHGPNRLTVSGPLPARRLAVVGEVWYPGWQAYVDGQPRRCLPVNYLLRGVPLEAAGQKLELVYFPGSFAVGAFLTCLALGMLAGVWAAGRTAR